MIVVANTSPVCYLLLIGCVDLLPQLFGHVYVPPAVRGELTSPDAPPGLAGWARNSPGWLEVTDSDIQQDAELSHLHAGEREAILLAEHLRADLIILDEKAARRSAAARGLRVTGTLGVLDEAATRGLVNLPAAVGRLRLTNFRVSARLLQTLLGRHS